VEGLNSHGGERPVVDGFDLEAQGALGRRYLGKELV